MPSPALGPTRQRASRQFGAVNAVLDEVDDFRSAQELHALLRERQESVGLTTVYRALQTLSEQGAVDVLRRADGEALYRRCSTRHHHHLVCRSCGKTVEVEGVPVERWATRVAGQHGFVDIDHTVEVYGTCADCAEG